MKTLLPSALVLALAVAAPTLADAQDRGNGRGGGQERGDDRGRGNDDRGGPQNRGGPERGERGRDDDRGNRGRGEAERAVRAIERSDRGEGRRGPDPRDAVIRVDPRQNRVVVADRDDDRADGVIFRSSRDRGLIAGCPPGLARKNNGCLPPGLARKADRDLSRYDYLWARPADNVRYRYGDGYVYRYDNNGSVMGWLPVLGGALGVGNLWPTQYQYQPAPAYYTSYYGLPDRYDYRYADGVLYGVDPQTRAIGQIAALLTGQQWNVGQTMPTGYDVYNVPYQYRSQYVDTPDRWYRYSDGYVYQVDPTTQLVQAAIQLLT